VLLRAAIGAGLAVGALALTGCGGSSSPSAADQTVRRLAALYEIDQIERTWHQAASTHNLDLMMSIWAPGATMSYGGLTYTGKDEIRRLFAGSGAFNPKSHLISDTPAFKIRTTVNGDVGTLYFQCHYVDPKTRQVVLVVGADENVKQVHGTWLITSSTAATTTLR